MFIPIRILNGYHIFDTQEQGNIDVKSEIRNNISVSLMQSILNVNNFNCTKLISIISLLTIYHV